LSICGCSLGRDGTCELSHLLLILTVLELSVTFLPWSKEVQILILLGLAVWKALLVALFFMHLKWEGNRMRIFAIAPLPLTVIIVLAVLTEYVW